MNIIRRDRVCRVSLIRRAKRLWELSGTPSPYKPPPWEIIFDECEGASETTEYMRRVCKTADGNKTMFRWTRQKE